MDKQKGIKILEEILEKANQCGFLWDGEPSPVQQSSQANFYFKEENKLNVFSVISKYFYSGMNGAYISVGKSKYTLNRDFGYWFDGRCFYPQETKISHSSEEVYNFLERMYRGEKNLQEKVGKEILAIENFFNKGIQKALEIIKKDKNASA
jgi:hypothetical protein